MPPIRILILGGGFGGVATALELERRTRGRTDLEVTLVHRDNFFLFTPMLHEVAAGDLDVTNIVSPMRTLLRRVRFFCGEATAIDADARRVSVRHGEEGHPHELEYDHLVVALGSVTNTYGLPGVSERAQSMRSLGDAIALRNRIIAHLEEADFECCAPLRRRLLTFVVAGGGFAGVETAASVDDFVHEALPYYRNLSRDQVRTVIVHSGTHLLPELGVELGDYARRTLERRGVDVRLGRKVASFGASEVVLDDGSAIESATLVWTAGTAPHPLLASLPFAKEGGRLRVDEHLAVPDRRSAWALGDCAVVPDARTGRPHPPTAQHALRQGRTLARNILASIDGRPLMPFRFRTLGQLASLGRRRGVAKILGIRFSGFIAWWLWRTIYLSKLPRLEKKLRVALDWTLDLLFPKDLVQFQTTRSARSDDRASTVRAPHTAIVSRPATLAGST